MKNKTVINKSEEIEAKVTSMAMPLMEKLGLLWVDTEYVKEHGENYLRIIVDKEGGVTIDDCVALTKPMNDLLDTSLNIDEAYIFEVSSPGLDRPLKKEADYKRCMGKLVEVKLYAPINGKKEYVGDLCGYDDNSISIEIEGKSESFLKDKIAIIKQAIVF